MQKKEISLEQELVHQTSMENNSKLISADQASIQQQRKSSVEEDNDTNRPTEESNIDAFSGEKESQKLIGEDESEKWFQLKVQLSPQQKIAWIVFKIILGLSLLFTGAWLFLVELEKGCPEDKYEFAFECMELLNSQINYWIKLLPVICFCLLSVFILGYYKFFDPYRIFMGLAAIEMIVLCFCIYSLDLSKADERHFGPAQCLALIGFLAIFALLFLVFRGMVWLFSKQKIVFFSIIATLACLFGWFIYEMAVSCKGWEQGLQDSLNFSEPYCTVREPAVCWPVVFDEWFDLSPNSCQIKEKKYEETKKSVLSKYGLSENQSESWLKHTNYIAWPIPSYFLKEQRQFDTMQKSIMDQTVVVDSVEEGFKKGHEAVIDLKNMQLNIEVNRNQTLVDMRKQWSQEHPDLANGVADNVIVIYIDTLSRAQTHRKLPKSMEFLKKFTRGKSDKNEVYEFFRFHAIDKQTVNNVFKLHFDHVYSDVYDNFEEFEEKTKTEKVPNLMRQWKQSGHITGHSSNTCTSQCAFREDHLDIQHMFEEDAADHEFLVYDPLYINPDNYFDTAQGPGSLARRCLYNNDTNAFIFDYGYKFLQQYKNEKKALYLEFTDSHEMTSEVVQYMDDHMYNFLLNIEADGLIDESTVLYVMADHGQHLLPTFYMNEKKATPDMWEKAQKQPNKKYTNDVYKLERMLPVFMMLVSRDILDKNPSIQDNLHNNQQITFGMAQARNTLIASVSGSEVENGKYSLNLFNELDPSRDCRDIGMIYQLNQEQFCVCRPRF